MHLTSKQINKSKNKQLVLHQTIKLLHRKKKEKRKIINKVKWQPTEWEKIFANHILDKGLMSKYIKISHKSMAKKKKKKKRLCAIQLNNEQKIQIDIFLRKTYRCQQARLKRCSTSITNHQGNADQNHNEITPGKIAIIKKIRNSKC